MSVFGIKVDPSSVCVFDGAVSKDAAIDGLVDAVANGVVIPDRNAFRAAVHARESLMSTGIGSGVAIPHVRVDGLKRPAIGVGVSRKGIEFAAADNQPVNILVLFAMPPASQKEYLGLLAQVMVALRMPGFRERLAACRTPEEIVTILNGA